MQGLGILKKLSAQLVDEKNCKCSIEGGKKISCLLEITIQPPTSSIRETDNDPSRLPCATLN